MLFGRGKSKMPTLEVLSEDFELATESLPLAKTGSFFVSFCVFEGA
jgi:hypothetical protein